MSGVFLNISPPMNLEFNDLRNLPISAHNCQDYRCVTPSLVFACILGCIEHQLAQGHCHLLSSNMLTLLRLVFAPGSVILSKLYVSLGKFFHLGITFLVIIQQHIKIGFLQFQYPFHFRYEFNEPKMITFPLIFTITLFYSKLKCIFLMFTILPNKNLNNLDYFIMNEKYIVLTSVFYPSSIQNRIEFSYV